MATKESLNQAFFDMCVQLLEASVAAWPEDALLPLALSQFRLLNPSRALELFETYFGSYASRLAQKDLNAIEEISKLEVVGPLNIYEKFTSSNANTQGTLWAYLGHICKFSSMDKLYKHIPGNILASVTEAAESLKLQLDNGSVDPSNVNPFDLGKQVMAKFSTTEVETMMNDLMKNQDAMNVMMSQLSTMMQDSNNSGLDLSSIMKLMNQ